MRYTRMLSPAVQTVLSGDEPLACLVRDFPTWVEGDGNALDVHLREGNRLTYYLGTTALLHATFSGEASSVRFSADPAYASVVGYSEIMRSWLRTNFPQAAELVPAYLRSAVIAAAPRYYANRAEGYWQNVLSITWGRNWTPALPWLVFDREAVIGFDDDASRRRIQRPIQETYLAIRKSLQVEEPGRWGTPAEFSLGNQIDLLALGPEGQLVAIELKFGGNAAGVYWAPLQAFVYHDILAEVADIIWPDIVSLVKQRISLGLLPATAESRISERCPGVAAAVVVAMPNDRSSCWDLAARVMQRCPQATVPFFEVRDESSCFPIPRRMPLVPGPVDPATP